jgi:hypothetical protein
MAHREVLELLGKKGAKGALHWMLMMRVGMYLSGDYSTLDEALGLNKVVRLGRGKWPTQAHLRRARFIYKVVEANRILRKGEKRKFAWYQFIPESLPLTRVFQVVAEKLHDDLGESIGASTVKSEYYFAQKLHERDAKLRPIFEFIGQGENRRFVFFPDRTVRTEEHYDRRPSRPQGRSMQRRKKTRQLHE